MICFVVGQGTNRFMVSEFFHEYMSPQALGQLRFVDTEYLETRAWPEARVWVFIGLDQQPNRAPLVQIESELRTAGKIVLNAPSRAMPRYELAKVLAASGMNMFDVHASDSDPDTWQFPVFARFRRRHEGTSPLLYNADDIARVFKQNPVLGTPEGMIVEFLETKSPVDELYRKYSVIRIGDHYVPRHI
ncbi:MAG: hypothetical protein ACREJC_18075, partial [Tepidisphaeraceae bacterium]